MRTYAYLIIYRGMRHTEHAHSPGQALHQAIENRAFGPDAWRYYNKQLKQGFGPLSITQKPDKGDYHGSQHALFN